MGKSLLCMREAYVHQFSGKQIGDRIIVYIGYGQVKIEGDILFVRQFDHGKIFIVNHRKEENRGSFSNGFIQTDFVVFWISSCCAQSGIMNWNNLGSLCSKKGPDPDLAIVKQEWSPPPKPYIIMAVGHPGIRNTIPLLFNGKKITFATRQEAEIWQEKFVEALTSAQYAGMNDQIISALTIEQEK